MKIRSLTQTIMNFNTPVQSVKVYTPGGGLPITMKCFTHLLVAHQIPCIGLHQQWWFTSKLFIFFYKAL